MIPVSFSYVFIFYLFIYFFCYFMLLLIFRKIILFLLLYDFFSMKIIYIFSCSGMFRNVPACSGMYRAPGFIDALSLRINHFCKVVWNGCCKHNVINQSTHLHYHDSAKPFYKPLSNEAVYLSTRTELNHRNYTVCKMDMQVQFLRCKH